MAEDDRDDFQCGQTGGDIHGTYSEIVPDADLNGKYDALVITAEVSVTELGDYHVIGDLKDQAGKTFSSASGIFAASAPRAFSVAPLLPRPGHLRELRPRAVHTDEPKALPIGTAFR